MRLKRIMKQISIILTASMLNLCWMTSFGWAEMVKTQEIPHQITREMLINALNRAEVQKQLEQHGISQVEAVVRINSLTDEEISAGWAAMRKTKEALKIETPPQITRGMLIDALNREEVQEQLEHYGISQVETVVRINSLTDEEISALVEEMDDLPAGGQAEAAIAEGTVFGAIIIAALAVIAVILAGIAIMLVIYLVAVLLRGIECIFSDCEAKGGLSYVFGPLRTGTGNSSFKTDDGDYQEDGHTGNTFPTTKNADDFENEDCDPGTESCT